jgi:1,4-dihydroxy-2-naphthoate octaprenyltransferase
LEIKKNALSLQRWLAFIAVGVVVLLIALHLAGNIWFLLMGGLAFFLGATDFGRQCPLLLSMHHLYARIQEKKLEQ